MASFVVSSDKEKKLISDVREVMIDIPEGIEVKSFWNAFKSKHQYLPDPKEYGKRQRDELLDLCSEVISFEGSVGKEKLFYTNQVKLNCPGTDQNSAKKSRGLNAQKREVSNIPSEGSPATCGKKSALGTNCVEAGRRHTNPSPFSARQLQQSPKPSGSFIRPTREQLNSVAEDCIERLAESKDYVSVERITKLLLQHYSVNSISELGLRHIDELKCVYDLIRSECKVNAYIQAFVKVRSICSVYELSECLKEFTQNRQDFETLHHGPLVKLPIVFEYFKMPPESDLCEITTADIIESLRQFLSENNLWIE